MIFKIEVFHLKENDFHEWLLNIDKRDIKQARDCVSRARRIERAASEYFQIEIDLDDEYMKDNCETIFGILSADKVKRADKSINLPMNDKGLTSLKSTLKKYVRFCRENLG